jgi:enediyne biosynthesis protein E3
MSNFLRTTRASLLTPNRAMTQLDTRGFHVKDEQTRERLEAVGARFLDGFQHALEARGPAETAARLDAVDTAERGFAYEGAGMALALLDGMTPGGGNRTSRFVAGPAAPHFYMVFVGIGWALAKLPKWRWRAVKRPDHLSSWLVLDGYGFYHAFFDTEQYVHRHYVDVGARWPADALADYTLRVIDQGVGRAMWFVAGADPELAATLIERFPEPRQADLWSGMGLAATYAGAADEVELKTLRERAGRYRPELAQGAAFAAKARVLAGLVTAHTPVATAVFCGRTPEEVAAITDEMQVGLPADGAVPTYEVWRQRIQGRFTDQL